jgi:hypothetical protein
MLQHQVERQSKDYKRLQERVQVLSLSFLKTAGLLALYEARHRGCQASADAKVLLQVLTSLLRRYESCSCGCFDVGDGSTEEAPRGIGRLAEAPGRNASRCNRNAPLGTPHAVALQRAQAELEEDHGAAGAAPAWGGLQCRPR